MKGCALGSGWGRPLGGVRSPLGGSSFELVLSEAQLLSDLTRLKTRIIVL